MKDKMLKALNEQINKEFYSGYMYLSMAAYFESINLAGFAKWMRVQAKEEYAHGMKIYDHIYERRAAVALLAIDAPPVKWKSPLDVFEVAFKHEQKVTGMINKLVALSIELEDYASNSFLQWFVDEQVEEESNADQIVQKLKMVGDNVPALLMLDAQLGGRSA